MKRNLAPFALLGVSLATMASCTPSSSSIFSSSFGSDESSVSSATISSQIISQSTGSFIDTSDIYTITFSYCGQGNDVVKTGKKGAIIELPKAPAKAGLSFVGWSKTYNPTTKWGNLNDVLTGNYIVEDGNVVFYACYIKADTPHHSEEEIDQYMGELAKNSEANHFYLHYYRFLNDASSYADWDLWAWSYKPNAGEGAKFDWEGRTTSPDGLSATGDAIVDNFGGATIDIDLGKTYDGGWDNTTKTMGGTPVSYEGMTKIGLQIVQSSTRVGGSGFWVNDGSNLYVKLEDYALENEDKSTSYHVFVIQDSVQKPMARPAASTVDPFEEDDGTNTTFGNSDYDNVDWKKAIETPSTSEDFTKFGVGYQIMVSSFADSDGDGFGDIYGIYQRLDYLEKLGVKALWLTPIQLSDSYHGYDITDYEKVDPKYGSATSPAGIENKGEVTSETALKDYELLVNESHKRGMKIVMDLVLNHTSTSNNWFISSANLDANYRGFYQWGNHLAQPGIDEDHFWYPYGDHPYSYYAKFGSAMPELNYSFKSTREAVEHMSSYWAKDVGVDGFRLDAVKHIYMLDEISSHNGDTVIIDDTVKEGKKVSYSSDLTKNLNFFKELKVNVSKDAGKNVFFVGENFDGHAYHVAPYYEAFDSMFDFYTYFNLTSAAATGRKNSTSGFGTAQGFLQNNGAYSASSDATANDAGGILAKANNSAWNFPSVYATYNKYRGGTSLPGCFTSNHDIARVINRIAGSGTAAGLEKQGNVNETNYRDLEKSANCVKIAELMFPGVTWVYYGDEIGMTGNFPEGSDADSSYADLWYRQPMKWVENGEKGDGSLTTDYYVTGSSQKVESDEINSSSLVAPALAQMEDGNSEYSLLSKFIKIKNENPALIQGSFKAENFASGNLAANVLCFSRSYNGTKIKVAVNFNASEIGIYGMGGTVLGTYNGASESKLPAYSALVVKE